MLTLAACAAVAEPLPSALFLHIHTKTTPTSAAPSTTLAMIAPVKSVVVAPKRKVTIVPRPQTTTKKKTKIVHKRKADKQMKKYEEEDEDEDGKEEKVLERKLVRDGRTFLEEELKASRCLTAEEAINYIEVSEEIAIGALHLDEAKLVEKHKEREIVYFEILGQRESYLRYTYEVNVFRMLQAALNSRYTIQDTSLRTAIKAIIDQILNKTLPYPADSYHVAKCLVHTCNRKDWEDCEVFNMILQCLFFWMRACDELD